ncbi:MAG: hypothetical protein N3E51_03000 [Candidatus Micrarchaeota archaeon]|nr:hypothetical protein [Candidatus Micrarchaeota archaeon]
MEDSEKQALLAKAARLEGKLLFVKAAEIYLKLEMPESAAAAYEKGGAYEKAAALFEKLGRAEDAARCRAKRDAEATGQTWQDLQAEFQKDKGNPL